MSSITSRTLRVIICYILCTTGILVYGNPPARTTLVTNLANENLKSRFHCPARGPASGRRTKRDDTLYEDFQDEVCHLFSYHQRPIVYQTVNDVNNPVYEYGTIPAARKGEPTLPVYLRAKITRSTLKPPGTRTSSAISQKAKDNCVLMGMNKGRGDKNNDENGHLIGWQNGGPGDVYNIVPQHRLLNRGANNNAVIAPSVWFMGEKDVNEFIRKTGGYVEVDISVDYEINVSTRPVGFKSYERHYLPNGTELFRTKHYFDNDPDDI